MGGLLGRAAGNYTLVEIIGHGGMGEVFRAINPALEAQVAIKVLNALPAANAADGSRFLLEARAVNRIKHEGVTNILDGGFLDVGRPYLVMELLDGESLAAMLARTPRLPLAQAFAILDALLDIVAAAHAAGIVHRDLKPANVFLSGVRCTILDFGVAKLLDGTGSVTRTGAMVGTPAYMAPEQVHADTIDGRADLYALGVILYEMIVGARPFTGPTPFAIVQAHTSAPIPRLPTDVPPAVQTIVDRALAKQPADRYASAAEMRAAIAPYLHDRASLPQLSSPARRRSRVWIAVLAALVIGGGITAIVAARGGKDGAAGTASGSDASAFEAEWRPIHDELAHDVDTGTAADLPAIEKKTAAKSTYLQGRWPAFKARVETVQALRKELEAAMVSRNLLETDLPLGDFHGLVRSALTLDLDDTTAQIAKLMVVVKTLPIDRALVAKKFELARTQFEGNKAGHPAAGVDAMRTRLEEVEVLADKGDYPTANARLQQIIPSLKLWQHSISAPPPPPTTAPPPSAATLEANKAKVDRARAVVAELEGVMTQRKLIRTDVADSETWVQYDTALMRLEFDTVRETATQILEHARTVTPDRALLRRKAQSVKFLLDSREGGNAPATVIDEAERKLSTVSARIDGAADTELAGINDALYALHEELRRWKPPVSK